MKFRAIILALSLMLLPAVAMADNSTPVQSGGDSSLLGPTTSNTQGTPSNNGLNSLQPAGSNGSAGNNDASALNNGSSQQLQVMLSGEADGGPQNTDATSAWLLDGLIIGLGVLLVLIGILVRRRQLLRIHRNYVLAPSGADSESSIEPEVEATQEPEPTLTQEKPPLQQTPKQGQSKKRKKGKKSKKQ